MTYSCIDISLIRATKILEDILKSLLKWKEERRKMIFIHHTYFDDNLIYFYQGPVSPTKHYCCHWQIIMTPQRLWQSCHFSVLSSPASRCRHVRDEILDHDIRKQWYPLYSFDKIQRMFIFLSGVHGYNVYIFNYSKDRDKMVGDISPPIQRAFFER